MKHCTMMIVLAGALLAGGSQADEWRNTWQGGLIGGAVGALVSRRSDVDSRIAIPAFAATGALLGYGSDRGWFDSRRDDRYYMDYGWPYRYGSGTDYRGRYRPTDYRRIPVVRSPSVSPSPAARLTPSEAAVAPDRHPGVIVETVAVKMPNGVTVPVRVLKLNGRYIGPRGETYSERPTADDLRRTFAQAN